MKGFMSTFVEIRNNSMRCRYATSRIQDNAVGIMTRLQDRRRGTATHFSAGARDSSLTQNTRTGSGCQPASYSLGTSDSSAEDNAAGE